MHGRVVESWLLPTGTDLKGAFVVAMLEHIDAGWQLGEFGSRGGVFFCTRATERRHFKLAKQIGRASCRERV